MKKYILPALALIISTSSTFASSELDEGTVETVLPSALIVRIDSESGETSVYKSESDEVASAEEAQSANDNYLTDINEIKTVALDELDEESSTEAWYHYHPHYRYGPRYRSYPRHRYGYYHYGYYYRHVRYNYRPYYYYRTPTYYYYYYRAPIYPHRRW